MRQRGPNMGFGVTPTACSSRSAGVPAPARNSSFISRPAPDGVTKRDIRPGCRKENVQASEGFGSTENSCHSGRFSTRMIQPLSHDHSLSSKVDCWILICFLISALVFAWAPPATAQEEIHSLL